MKWEGDVYDHKENVSDHKGVLTKLSSADAGFDVTDHLNTKNHENVETQNSKISDQVISNEKAEAKTVTETDLQPDDVYDHVTLLPQREFYEGCPYQYGDRVNLKVDHTKHTFWVIGTVQDKLGGKNLILQDNTDELFRPFELSEVIPLTENP